VAAEVIKTVRAFGLTAALNSPYAGAHGVTRHGRPAAHIHALQIEIDRTLYLERDMRTPSTGLDRTQTLLAALGHAALAAAQPPFAIAAE
jgi:N-formylglutamate amidohydrolase